MKTCIQLSSCLFLLSVLFLTGAHGQDLTGIWRGHFRSNDGLERLTGYEDRFHTDDRYKMEVQIVQTQNRFDAITYSYKSSEFYGKAHASGTWNKQTKKVLLKEGKLIEVRFTTGTVCMMTCVMQYAKLGNDEYLQGTYFTNNKDSTIDCGKGSIFLHRVTESDFYKEPFLEKKEEELLANKNINKSHSIPKSSPEAIISKTITPSEKVSSSVSKESAKTVLHKKKVVPQIAKTAVPKNHIPELEKNPNQVKSDSILKMSAPMTALPVPDVLKDRVNELLKTITVNNGIIELRIYDDGAIDNDTVTVYYDDRLLISKARLSDQPITIKIQVDPSEHPHALIMVAENMGEIPPNTSLLVVRDGEKRYEERIISTEQKNVQINFVYKKIE
jgi:hypothetical protein